jgi:hypothetical protein
MNGQLWAMTLPTMTDDELRALIERLQTGLTNLQISLKYAMPGSSRALSIADSIREDGEVLDLARAESERRGGL